MKERPILFSGPMVRALLDGSKTQTRRVVNPQFAADALPVEMPATDPAGGWVVPGHSGVWWCDAAANPDDLRRCPYGQPGDRLWVRETWNPDPPDADGWGYTAWAGCRQGQIAGVPERFRHPRHCNYAADWTGTPLIWTPSIHMPRWASRILLEVTDVRVERLQGISDADSLAEGIDRHDLLTDGDPPPGWHRGTFEKLWERINGADSWAANPWVWAVSFKRVQP